MTKVDEPGTKPEGTPQSKESPPKSDKTTSTKQKTKFKSPEHVPNKYILKLYEDYDIVDFPSTGMEATQVIPYLNMMCNRLEHMYQEIVASTPTLDESLYDAKNSEDRATMQIMQSQLSLLNSNTFTELTKVLTKYSEETSEDYIFNIEPTEAESELFVNSVLKDFEKEDDDSSEEDGKQPGVKGGDKSQKSTQSSAPSGGNPDDPHDDGNDGGSDGRRNRGSGGIPIGSSNNRSRSNQVDARKPKMGGLIDTYYGKEAWTGGKPKWDWSGLQDPSVVDLPLPTQMRSSSSKAAAGHAKRTEGIFTDENYKYKQGGDLDDLCERLRKHFEKHGLDTIAYRLKPNVATNEMVSVFTHYPEFTFAKMRKQNETICQEYDAYDTQNDNDALECFMNCLGEELRRRIRVKSKRDMKFSDIFMMFIDIERPQNAELYDSYEHKVLNMQASSYPGADIVAMAEYARENIVAMIRGNAWDSKNNIALTRILIEAGGKDNDEYSHPMHQLLTKAREEVSQVSHLNNREKDHALSQKEVGWEDILGKAEELYRTMTVDGSVRWPPACNINDSRAPPRGYGANLTQYKFNNGKKDKKTHSKNKNNGQHKKQSFKKKTENPKNGSWKNERPKKHQLERHVNGVPVYSQQRDGRKYWWCEKCEHKGKKGFWTVSHHTNDHIDDFKFKKAKNNKAKSHGQVNMGEGLAPQYNLWLAEVQFPKHPDQSQRKNRRKRHSSKRFGRRFDNTEQWFNSRRLRSIRDNQANNAAKDHVPSSRTSANELPVRATHSAIDLLVLIMGLTLISVSINVDWSTILLSSRTIVSSLWKNALNIDYRALIYPVSDMFGIVVAPMMWASMLIATISGRSTLNQWYPDDASPVGNAPNRTTRRYNEYRHKKLLRERNKLSQRVRQLIRSNEIL